jgi:hypothetical protein
MARSGDLQFEWTHVHCHTARSESEWLLQRNESAANKSQHKWNTRKLKKGLFGDTALHIAALQGDLKTLEESIFGLPELTVFNVHGWTPLHCAAASGNTRVAKLLISRGADPAAVDAKRKVTIQNVAQGEDMLKLLQQAISGGIQAFTPSRKKTPGKITEPSEVDKDKLLSAGYYLLKCLDSMGNVSETEQFLVAIKVLFYKSWKRYCSGEKQLDRIIIMLNQAFVSSWKPKSDGSIVANSLLSYSCTERKKSWQGLEMTHSAHPKRIGHCWPLFVCPLVPRCAIIVNISAEMNRFPARPGTDSSTLHVNQYFESINDGSTMRAFSGESSHVTAVQWAQTMSKTFQITIKRINKLAKRKHASLTTKAKGQEFTRIELIARRILKFLQTLCSPGCTMSMDMKPSYCRPFVCEENIVLTQTPKNFPSGPGLLENFGTRYLHVWAWIVGLGTTPYPPRLPSLTRPGDHPPIRMESDPLQWLGSVSECLTKFVPGFKQEPLLQYMLSPMWRPTLARVNMEIPGLVARAPGHIEDHDAHPYFYATALSFPLPPFCQNAALFYLPATSRLDVANSIFSPFTELAFLVSDEHNPKPTQTLPAIERGAGIAGRTGQSPPRRSGPNPRATVAREGPATMASPSKIKRAARLSGTLWLDTTSDAMDMLARHWTSSAAFAAALESSENDTEGYGSSNASP